MKNISGESLNITEENIKAVQKLFPEAFEEGKIDFDVLKQLLGDFVDDEEERYSFKWNGKGKALRLSQTPSLGTLRPCKEESKNWDKTENLYIEGDNLEVLKLLQKSYYGKVKMIYIDPPYNTGGDFVYKDDFRDNIENYKRVTGQLDGQGHKIDTNTESNGRFHTDWLNMIYPRLRLAKDLLSDDGVIFISIDDNEQENLKKICDEVFGARNFIAQINWKGRGGRQDSRYFAAVHEYIFAFSKNKKNFVAGEEIKTGDIYPKFDEKKGRFYKTQLLRKWGSNSKREDRPNLYYPIVAPDGTEVYPVVIEKDKQRPSNFIKFDGRWRHAPATMQKNIDEGKVEFIKQPDGSWIAYEKIFAPLEGEEKTKKYTTWIEESNDGANIIKNLFSSNIFDYPKNTSLLNRFLKMGNVEENDIILDFFSGSATTAQAVLELNAEDNGKRKFIMVQLPEPTADKSEAKKAGYNNICEIGEERIRRAAKKIKEETGADIDYGFRVFKVDSSNMKDVYYRPQDFRQEEMELFADNIKEGRMPEDLLIQVMLDLGVLLSSKIEEKEICGKKIFYVDDGYLIACFDENITEEIVVEIAKKKPFYAVFRDSSMENDAVITNFEQIFETYSPQTVRKVL